MRVHGRKEIALHVFWPPTEAEAGTNALAIAPEIFGDLCGEPENMVTLPSRIGTIILHEGYIVNAIGNVDAKSGAEVQPHIISVEEDTI